MPVRRLVFLLLGLLSLCAFGGVFMSVNTRPQPQAALTDLRVYAYRDWQGTAHYLHPGDSFTVRARGEWLYSPFVGLHGPAGSAYHLAPLAYPLPDYAGGALIGRIGESGQPFYVGTHTTGSADEAGQLFLRIDDDRLGDNDGALTIEISVTRPLSTQPDAQPIATPRGSVY
jgi:hypothetical protein